MELFKLLGTIAINSKDAVKDIDDIMGHSKDMSSTFNKAADTVGTYGKKVLGITASISAAIGTYAVKAAVDFETAFAKVSTLLDKSNTSFDKYKNKIIEASTEANVSTNELSEAIYQSISASVDQADAIDFTLKAVKLAKGGFTNTATAVDLLTTAINAYGLSADDADSLCDKLITTQNKGKTTVDELASAMGKVIPTAKTFGVSIDELCGYYATMTANGIATAETTTYLNGMLNELGVAGTQANEQLMLATESLKAGGMTYQECLDSGMSVIDMLDLMNKSAADNGKTMMDMFGSSEAAKAATVLSSNIGNVKKNIDAMGNSAGATEEAYKKMEDTVSAKTAKIQNSLKNMFTKLGQNLMPSIQKFLTFIEKKLPAIQKLISTKLQPALENMFEASVPVVEFIIEDLLPTFIDMLTFLINNFAVLAATVGITVAVLKTMAIISTIKTAIEGTSGAFAAFNAIMAANPIGAVVTAVGALAVGIGGLVMALTSEANKEDEVTRRLKEERAAREENMNAIKDNMAAIDKKAESQLTELTYTEKLWKELQNLMDANGNVAESDRQRADFIINELNNALGTEITMNNGVVSSTDGISESINNLIATKKAQILLEAQEEKYKAALNEQQQLQNDLTEANNAINEAQIKINQANANAEEEKRKAAETSSEAGQRLHNNRMAQYQEEAEKATQLLEEQKSHYQELLNTSTSTLGQITEYEQAYQMMQEGNTQGVIDLLSNQGQAFVNLSSLVGKSVDEQMAALKNQVDDTQDKVRVAQDMFNTAEENQKDYFQKLLNDAKEKAQAAKDEYKLAGETLPGAIAEGIESNTPVLYRSVTNSLSLAIDNGKANLSGFSNIGVQIVNGIASGIESNTDPLFSQVSRLMQNTVSAAQKAAEIHSPSRLFAKKIGAFIPSGIGKGIEDNEEDAMNPLNNMIDSMASSESVASNSEASVGVQNSSGVIANKIDQLIEVVKGLKIYLNNDILVGELAPAMDAQLGQIYSGKERGR